MTTMGGIATPYHRWMYQPRLVMDADRFREALSSRDRVNLLSQQLASFSLEHLLVKFGAIEKFEADEIKTTSKSGEERIRRIIERLLAKNSLNCFKEFAKVVYFKNALAAREIFPFVDWSQESNRLRVVSQRTTAVAPAPLHPDVIWLCSDEKVFTAACDVAGVSSEFLPMHSTPSKTYKYYEVPSDEPVRVWVFSPTGSLSREGVVKLLSYYNQVKFCLFTGRCGSVSIPALLPVDVLVAWQAGEFIAELEHVTALWRLTGSGEWTCPNVKHNRVIFAPRNQVVDSPEGVAFINGSEEICRAASTTCATILSCEVGEWCSGCGDGAVTHAVNYSHQILKYLIEKLVLSSILAQY